MLLFLLFFVTYEAPSFLQPTCIRDFARMSQKWNSGKKVTLSLLPSSSFARGTFLRGNRRPLFFPESKFENSGKTIPLRLEGGKRETCISSSFSPRDKKSQDLRMFSREGENGVFLLFFLLFPIHLSVAFQSRREDNFPRKIDRRRFIMEGEERGRKSRKLRKQEDSFLFFSFDQTTKLSISPHVFTNEGVILLLPKNFPCSRPHKGQSIISALMNRGRRERKGGRPLPITQGKKNPRFPPFLYLPLPQGERRPWKKLDFSFPLPFPSQFVTLFIRPSIPRR